MENSTSGTCPAPGCSEPLPPRNTRSGYQPKFCPSHARQRVGSGRPVDPSNWVDVSCAACAAPVQRRASLVAKNKSGRFFCSDECRNLVGSKPRRGGQRGCAICGNEFYARTTSEQVACSPACAARYKARNQVTRSCAKCGAEMVLPPSLSDRRFCSLECAGHADTKTDLTCEQCGGKYRGRPQEGRRFCSKPCFYAWQTANATGSVDAAGYRLITDDQGEYRREHRVVMERVLRRRLGENERVHHLDSDRLHNDPSNLLLMITEAHPAGAAIGDLVDAYERRLKELRKDLRRLRSVGAGTTIRDSHTAHRELDPPTLFDEAG